jgi:DNA-directed RNA polymerase subunit K/omega
MSQQSLDESTPYDVSDVSDVSDVELENDDNHSKEEVNVNNDDNDENDNNELNMQGGAAEDDSEDYFGGVEEEKEEKEEKEEEDITQANKSKIKQLEGTFTDDDDDDDEQEDNYLMKFDREIRKNYLVDFHPETIMNNYSEIQALVNITRDNKGIIIDEFHKTLPFLTKYEKTRILGQRAKQINSGSIPYIDLKKEFQGKRVIDGYLIALKELELKRIPFIIRRPLPNGGSEYWRLKDLDIIN